jgi:sulfite exporter TauE/SafE
MDNGLLLLLGTAATVGFVHTALGPDHYVPFIVLSKARGWTPRRTFAVTALCGVGHVLGSVVLGFVGVAAGVALLRLEIVEALRGDIAAWLLMGFGFAYLVWGLHRALKNRPHEHAHTHEDGVVHAHSHSHVGEHAHPHGADGRSVTPWVLFLIFVFGPCEPLIPILMFPAAEGSFASVALVAAVFGLATVGTMLAVVALGYYGLARIRVRPLERFGHALAGLALFASGGAIAFLGL